MQKLLVYSFCIIFIVGCGIFPPPTTDTATSSREYTLAVQDDFNGGPSKNWSKGPCDTDFANVTDKKLGLSLPPNKSSNWVSCVLTPYIPGKDIRKVTMTITVEDGGPESGWIGIFASCGDDWFNIMANSLWIGYSGKNYDRTPIEKFTTLPITRTISIEWVDSQAIIDILESNKKSSIACANPPNFFNIGVGTNPQGSINGSIDDIRIWVTSK